ncbi:MAG: NlpC/P60 family protein [Paracoccaceae bacterium]
MADEPEPVTIDTRVTPVRPDLAALHLRGVIEAETYASGQPMRCAAPVAPISAAPDGESEQVSQLLFGEDFTAYEVEGGWAWGQCALDGYVGYVPLADLMPEPATKPSHRVNALQALIYSAPDLKSRPIGAVPFGARLTRRGTEETRGFIALDPGGFVYKSALKHVDSVEQLWISTALRFLGAPYLWGGRSAAGFDCSGLIQTALRAAGVECPRDSDMQLAALGREVSPKMLKRGDLVFWSGHVGIMTSTNMFLHANAHHMAVAEEPFETARSRIAGSEYGEIIGARRLLV